MCAHVREGEKGSWRGRREGQLEREEGRAAGERGRERRAAGEGGRMVILQSV